VAPGAALGTPKIGHPIKSPGQGDASSAWQDNVKRDVGVVAALVASPPEAVVVAAKTINQLCSGNGVLRTLGVPLVVPINFERRRKFINDAAHKVFVSMDTRLGAPAVRCVLLMLRLVQPAFSRLTSFFCAVSCKRAFQPLLCILYHFGVLEALVTEVCGVAKAYFEVYTDGQGVVCNRPTHEIRAMRAISMWSASTTVKESASTSKLDAVFSEWMKAFPDFEELLQSA
jgi:hypothetical protein